MAQWDGLSLSELIKLIRPTRDAKAVVFYSFSEGAAIHEGVEVVLYYDSHLIKNPLAAETIVAYDMHYEPLPPRHGAPLRLRVETQVGFKMVKWIRAIEFLKDIESIGEGGFAEDHEFFGELADI